MFANLRSSFRPYHVPVPTHAVALLAVVFVTGAAMWGADDEERTCDRERAAVFENVRRLRDDGPQVRRRLLGRLETLVERYQALAPVCTGRIREHEAFLYLMDDRYAELSDLLRSYLDGQGQRTSVRSQVILGVQHGYALVNQGEMLEGARAYFRAASLADKAPASYGSRALVNAGMMARNLGNEAEAATYFQAALDVVEDSLDVDDSLVDIKGHALTSLSILTDTQIRDAVASAERDSLVQILEAQTTEALSVLSTDGQPGGHRALSTNLNAIAAALDGRLDLARQRIRPARALARRAGMLVPLALFETYVAEGRIDELADDLDAAHAAYQRARAEAVRQKAPRSEAEALEFLGGVEERRARWDEAAAYYDAAIERRELERDRLGLEDWSSSAFATMQGPYRGLVRTRLAQGDVRGAFAVLDMTRARYLRDLQRHQTVRAQLRPDARLVVDSLTRSLSDARLAFLAAETPSERAELQLEVSALQSEIERNTGTLNGGVDTTDLDLAQLQRHLADHGRTLVSYFLDGERSTAFVLRQDTLVAVPLTATRASVQDDLRAVGAPWRGEPADPAFALPPLHHLYRSLVEPVEPWVETESVTILPDVDIATAPFAAFVTAPADDFKTAPYLLRQWTITTELAAALIVTTPVPRGETERTLDVLALGQSRFDTTRSTWNTAALGDLPYVSSEVARVTRGADATGLLNEKATEGAFREQAPTARVVHLASHAQADPSLPLYSRIALEPSPGTDGIVHLYELLEMPMAADLVVLSGCSTADGGRHDGEGLVGLQYGMRAAGSKASLATLWPVADEATAELMGTFYDGLGRGLGKDVALRRAQLAYLDQHDGLMASPFFWAAPVLSGDPAPVPFNENGPWWPILVAVLVVGAWLAWHLRPRPADA